MHTVMTRWGHGEKDKLELYEDGEFGTRPGRTRNRPGIDPVYIGMGPVTNRKNNMAGEITPLVI